MQVASIQNNSPQSCIAILIGKEPLDRVLGSHFSNEPLDKQEVVIPFSNDCNTEWTQFQYRNLSNNTTKSIIESSSINNWTTLAVVQDRVPITELYQVVHLIKNWPNQLHTLRLWLCYSGVNKQQLSTIHRLFSAVNSLSSLKNFSFELEGYLYGPVSSPPPLYLPFLTQLEQFSFFSYDDAAMLYNSFQKYITNERHCKIELGNPIRSALAAFCSTTTALASVTSIWIFLGKLPLQCLTTCLANLTQLTHLKLSIDFRTRAPFPSENVVPQSQFLPLPSIQQLTLHLITTNHANISSCHLGRIFTNLQVMRLCGSFQECNICSCVHHHQNSAQLEIQKECQENLTGLWKDLCGKLKKIIIIGSDGQVGESTNC